MPIYECSCGACGITFEILAPVSEANRRRPCPRCARPSPRVASAFAIGSASVDDGGRLAGIAAAKAQPGAHAGHSHPPRHGRPPVPQAARLCWMDDKSAERFAAYKMGRGAEYDDKAAAREDLRQKRGLPPAPANANSPVARIAARKKAEKARATAAAPTTGAQSTPSR